jgi:hypothetical protein
MNSIRKKECKQAHMHQNDLEEAHPQDLKEDLAAMLCKHPTAQGNL